MGHLVSGKVTYGRTVQPAQYESKKAEAEIAFAASEDGSDFDATLALAAQVAMDKVHEMVGIKKGITPAPAPAPAPVPAGVAQRTKADVEKEAFAAASAPKAAPTTRTAAKKPPAPVAAEPAPQIKNPEDRKEDAAAISDEDFSAPVEETAPPTKVITDSDLQAACAHHNAKIKNALPIRALIAKYATQLSSIKPEDRQKFLDELKEVKA